LGIAGISAGTAAFAEDDLLRAALKSRYAALKTAMAAHDDTAIAAILAPDFVSVDVTGQLETGSQMVDELKSLKFDPNKQSDTTLNSIVLAGDVAAVEQQYDMKSVVNAADGTQHHIELVARSTDTWIKTGNVWLIERTVTNEMSYFKDGQLSVRKVKRTD
jgi:ketosteroid isomerase-like protein